MPTDGVSLDECRDLFKRWRAKNPDGDQVGFELWVENLCGVKQPTVASAWRRADIDKCLDFLRGLPD